MKTLQDLAEDLAREPLTVRRPAGDVWRRGVRRRHRQLAAACTTLVVLLVVTLVGVRSFVKTDQSVSVSSDSGPTTTTTAYVPPWVTPDMLAQVQTKPSIPEPLRSQVIQAAGKLADCMDAHGYPAMPTLPDTYGDGNTAAGVMAVPPGLEAQFQQASLACRAELEDLRRDNLAIDNVPYEPLSDPPSPQTAAEDDRARALRERAGELLPGFEVTAAYSYAAMSTFVSLRLPDGTRIGTISVFTGTNPVHTAELLAHGSFVHQDAEGIQAAVLTPNGNEIVVMVSRTLDAGASRTPNSDYVDRFSDPAYLNHLNEVAQALGS